MAVRFLVIAALIFAPTAGFARESSLAARLQAQAASDSFLLRKTQAQPDQFSTAKTFATLDSNRDGRVDPHEVESFALAQGLDAVSASSEFATLDTNGDGNLDSAELTNALGDSGAPPPAAVVASPSAPAAVPVLETRQAKRIQTVVPMAKQVGVAMAPSSPALRVAPTPTASSRISAMAQSQETTGNGGETAISAADDLVALLAVDTKAEAEAEALERRVAELRATSTALARSTQERAMKAGAKAAQSKASELLLVINSLDAKAQDAEAKAAAMQAKSRAELQNAEDLVEVAHTTIQ